MAVKPIIFSLDVCVNFLFCVPYTITPERTHSHTNTRPCTHARTHALKHLIYLFVCLPLCKNEEKIRFHPQFHIHTQKHVLFNATNVDALKEVKSFASGSLLSVHHVQCELWQIDVFSHRVVLIATCTLYKYMFIRASIRCDSKRSTVYLKLKCFPGLFNIQFKIV